MFLFTGCGRWGKPCSMWIHHHHQASTRLQSFASEFWMFHLPSDLHTVYQPQILCKWVLFECFFLPPLNHTVYQPYILYQAAFVDILVGCCTPKFPTPNPSSPSATKFSESAASLPTSSTPEADLAALTRQVFKIMLFCLHKRSWPQDHRDLFCQPVCFVVTRDFDRKIIEIFLPAGRTRCSSCLLPDSLLRRRHRFPSIAKRSILLKYCSIIVALHKCKHYNDTQALPRSRTFWHHADQYHLCTS